MILKPKPRNVLRSLVYFSERIYPSLNAECSSNYMRICERCALKLLSNTIKIVGIIYFSCNIIPLFSISAYMINGEIQLPVPVIFPFTDLKSRNGMVINFLNQLFIAFMGVFGNIGIEIPTIMLKNTVWVMAAAMCNAIDDLNAKIDEPVHKSKMWVDYCFRNILIQAQDLDRYV